jgi:hypothetical protein
LEEAGGGEEATISYSLREDSCGRPWRWLYIVVVEMERVKWLLGGEMAIICVAVNCNLPKINRLSMHF